MANLQTADDLASYLGVATPSDTTHYDAILTNAQAACELFMLGEAGWLGTETSEDDTVYYRRSDRILPIENGPLASLTTVKINGETYTTYFEAYGYYAVRLKRQYPPTAWPFDIPSQSYVEVTYTRGWATANVPNAILQAILAEAADRLGRPAGSATRRTVGPITTWFGPRNAPGRPAISDDAAQFLSAFRNPRLIGAT